MTAPCLADILADATEHADGSLTYPMPADWAQGRTAYGGLVAAQMFAAARNGRAGLPPLRSALVNYTAPVSGPPRVGVEVLRQGRNVTTIHARATLDGKPAALGTFSFGAPQKSHVAVGKPIGTSPAPEACVPYIPKHISRLPAEFIKNFDMQMIEGARPFAGADEGYARVWARHKDPASWNSPEGLLCIADLLPPAVFPICTEKGMNSSMTWMCNLLAEEIATEDGWWMLETRLTAAQNGYSSQVMRLWNRAGDLVGEGMQSVVIFV